MVLLNLNPFYKDYLTSLANIYLGKLDTDLSRRRSQSTVIDICGAVLKGAIPILQAFPSPVPLPQSHKVLSLCIALAVTVSFETAFVIYLDR